MSDLFTPECENQACFHRDSQHHRSPPASILGTVSGFILISGWEREELSSLHDPQSSRMSETGGQGPGAGSTDINPHSLIRYSPLLQRSDGTRREHHSAQQDPTIG